MLKDRLLKRGFGIWNPWNLGQGVRGKKCMRNMSNCRKQKIWQPELSHHCLASHALTRLTLGTSTECVLLEFFFRVEDKSLDTSWKALLHYVQQRHSRKPTKIARNVDSCRDDTGFGIPDSKKVVLFLVLFFGFDFYFNNIYFFLMHFETWTWVKMLKNFAIYETIPDIFY